MASICRIVVADRSVFATNPIAELASTRFCLAEPGKAYLVYLPEGGEVTVDLSGASGQLKGEWMHPTDGTVSSAALTEGARLQTFKAPFSGDAVLYLWKE